MYVDRKWGLCCLYIGHSVELLWLGSLVMLLLVRSFALTD